MRIGKEKNFGRNSGSVIEGGSGWRWRLLGDDN